MLEPRQRLKRETIPQIKGPILDGATHYGVLCQNESGTASLVLSEKDMKQKLIPELRLNCINQAISTQVSFNHAVPGSSAEMSFPQNL